MSNDHKIPDLLLKELDKKELSRKEIKQIVLTKTETDSKKSTRKNVDKYLYNLLIDESIAVVGYDLSLSKHVNADGMIFASLKSGAYIFNKSYKFSIRSQFKEG